VQYLISFINVGGKELAYFKVYTNIQYHCAAEGSDEIYEDPRVRVIILGPRILSAIF
jgi:hypothetical protein